MNIRFVTNCWIGSCIGAIALACCGPAIAQRDASTSKNDNPFAATEKPRDSGVTRKWSDRSGKFNIEARFDGITDGKVALVKSDGKRIEVPLDKLSDEDKQFVRGLNETSDNPFAEASSPAETAGTAARSSRARAGARPSSAPGKKANWNGAKVVRPQTFSKWSFTPPAPSSSTPAPAADAANAVIPLTDIPGSKKFFEKVVGVYVADDGSRAVVCRQKGEVGGKDEQFMELVDLKENAAKGLTPLPLETAILDVLPDAGLVMYRPAIFGSGKNTILTIAKFDGSQLSTIKQFEPYAQEEWEPNRDVEKAWFLSSDRVMTLNHMGKLMTVWDINGTKALMNIPVGSWANLEIAFSPDRKLLAIIMKEAIAIIDMEAGKHVATIPAEGRDYNRVEFRGDNARLAGLSAEGLTVWDLTSGKKLHDFYHNSLNSRGELAWAGDFLLAKNQYLFDAARRILLWEYEGATSSAQAGQMRAGRLWVIPKASDGAESVLIGAPVPHAGAIQQASSLPPAEALLVVKPGDSVSIEVDIDPSVSLADEVKKALNANAGDAVGKNEKLVVLNPNGAQNDVVRQLLTNALESAGLKVVEHSDLVVKAVCKPQERQTIKVNMPDKPPEETRPGHPGFFRGFGTTHLEERTITPYASYLEMTLKGEVLLKRGYVARPFMTIWLEKDETLDQALDRLTKPNVGIFTHAKFSGYLARPGKATSNGAYGVSQITSAGVIDGKTGQPGAGGVFE